MSCKTCASVAALQRALLGVRGNKRVAYLRSPFSKKSKIGHDFLVIFEEDVEN